MQEMILASRRGGTPRRARPAAPVPAVGLRGDLRGDGGAAGDDPPARSAAARVPAADRGGDRRADAPADPRCCTRRTRCSARAAAGSASSGRRSTRCRCARSRARPKPCSERTGEAPLVEIMHPLVGFAEELRRLRELTVEVMQEEAPEIEYLCGTMIELPRAALRADEIAEHADFFSFGTNDLTQTTLGMSRDDAEGKFLTFYLEDGVLEQQPVRDARPERRRRPDAHRRRARPRRRSPTSSSASAASTGESRARSSSATGSGSTTSAARRTASRSRGSPRRRRR